MARQVGVAVALGALCAASWLLAACDQDDDFIPMGHEAGRGGDAGQAGGSPVVGRGGTPGSGTAEAGQGGGSSLGSIGAAGENGGAGDIGGQAGEAGRAAGGEGAGGGAGDVGGQGGEAGHAGRAAGGEGPSGGAGGSDSEGGVCDGQSVPVPENLPACTPADNDPDGDSDCRECLKQRCCEPWQACYGQAPRGACGYGPMGDEIGQMDCVLYCYYQDADGVKSVTDVIDGCVQKCVGSCTAASEATTDLLSCAVSGLDADAAGGDDCLDACFPPVP